MRKKEENGGTSLARAYAEKIEIEIVATNPPGLKPGQGVLPSDLQTLHYNLHDMQNLTPKIREDTTFQK
jgi:hypothetical protein